MNEKIINLIEFEPENSLLDFKREQYPIGSIPKRNIVIKDIQAMANNPSDEEKYIIIGVGEENGAKTIVPIAQLTDDAHYQQLVNANVEPTINFEYKGFDYQGRRIAYFKIFGNTDRPYLFKKDVAASDGKIEFKRGEGYIRKGTSTFILGRPDLDAIYQQKSTKKDRKNDIVVRHDFRTYHYSDAIKYPYLHISVENKSAQSVSFDAELLIFKNQLEVKSDTDIRREHAPRSQFGHFTPEIPSIFARIKKYKDVFEVKTTLKGGILINQEDAVEDIFKKHTILDYSINQNFRAVLVLRSDDFISGPLRYPIETTIFAS